MAYSLTYNGLTIDTTSKVTNTDLSGFGAIPIRGNLELNINSAGGNIFNQLYGVRNIGINGFVFGDNPNDFLAQQTLLINAFNQTNLSSPLTIVFWDAPATTYSINAKVIEPPFITYRPGRIDYAEFRVELVCEDPFFTEAAVNTETLFLDQISGFDINATDKVDINATTNTFDISSTGSNSTATINILGDANSEPTYTVTAGSTGLTNPTITNQTTGVSFRIDKTLNPSDTVTVQQQNNILTVLLNGTSNIFSDFAGDYIEFVPGNNVVNFSAQTFDAESNVVISYFNKYLTLNV